MIIIKISILYFIQIRHTDDFPSTGTRLVNVIREVKIDDVYGKRVREDWGGERRGGEGRGREGGREG